MSRKQEIINELAILQKKDLCNTKGNPAKIIDRHLIISDSTAIPQNLKEKIVKLIGDWNYVNETRRIKKVIQKISDLEKELISILQTELEQQNP